MKVLLLICFCTAFNVVTAHASSLIEPTIQNGQLKLGPNAQGALKALGDFKVYDRTVFTDMTLIDSDTPMFAVGDYNGDNLKDAVVIGFDRSTRKTKVLALISDKSSNTYKIHQVISEAREPKVKLMVKVVTTTKAQSQLKRDLISYESPGTSAAFYFSNKENRVKVFREVFD